MRHPEGRRLKSLLQSLRQILEAGIEPYSNVLEKNTPFLIKWGGGPWSEKEVVANGGKNL